MIEYERRFFVCAEGHPADIDETQQTSVITQGYLSTEGATVRVRSILRGDAGETFILTIKMPRTDGGKGVQEFETPIDDALGRSMLKACGERCIQKTRVRYASGWEVDHFLGFSIAEFEGDEDTVDNLTLPPWVLREIRHEEGFSNAALATVPDRYEAAAREWTALVAQRVWRGS